MNTLGLEKTNHSSKIVNPTHNLLAHDRGMFRPTQDYFENLVMVEHPQAEEERLGEANEMVEDIPGTQGTIVIKNTQYMTPANMFQ